MTAAHAPDDQQTALWNGQAGHAWVESQQLLDRLFEPFERVLMEKVAPASHVLDVGCGTGGTTLAAARRAGAEGSAVGIDLSGPMIAEAQRRAQSERVPARFVCADAQTYAFPPSSFDCILSRFGVMFFDDPVTAFANLRRAARSGAEMRLIVWRGPEDNAFMTVAERAAAPLLPGLLPDRRADEPSQFGFADSDRVRGILADAGWAESEVRPLDVACALPESELIGYFTRLGPLGRALPQADATTRARIVETVRAAFDRYVDGDEVRFDAACWVVDARAR